jgi:hypothetical protein
MAPRRLSEIKPDANVDLSCDWLDSELELVFYPMFVIATWSHIDGHFSRLFANMRKATRAQIDWFDDASTSRKQRTKALESAAADALGEHSNYHVFRAMLRVVDRERKLRDKCAHYLWGISHDVPDALLLVHPNDCSRRHLRSIELRNAFKQGGLELPTWAQADPKNIWVYFEDDLCALKKAAERANFLVTMLEDLLEYQEKGEAKTAAFCRKLLLDGYPEMKMRQAFEGSKAKGRRRG